MSHTFVLVHGGKGGGWCYRDTARILRAKGHEVYTPTLTGHGERSHLDTSALAFESFVADVANVLFYEDLRDVILVGTSMGGGLIPHVALVHPDRIRKVVFFASIVQRDGERDIDRDLTTNSPLAKAALEAQSRGDLVMFEKYSLDGMLGTDVPPELRAWAAERKGGPHETVRSARGRLTDFLALGIPTGYIVATRDAMIPPEQARQFASILPGCRVMEVDGPHEMMVTDPRATADALLAMADD